MTPEFMLEVMKNVILWGVLVYPDGSITLQGFLCDYSRVQEYPAQIISTRPTEDKVQIKLYLTQCSAA